MKRRHQRKTIFSLRKNGFCAIIAISFPLSSFASRCLFLGCISSHSSTLRETAPDHSNRRATNLHISQQSEEITHHTFPVVFMKTKSLYPNEDKKRQRPEGSCYEEVNQHTGSSENCLTRRFILQRVLSAFTSSTVIFRNAAALAVEPKECTNSAILAEASVPGAYQQVCMGIPERSMVLKATGDTITVLQGTSTSTGSDGNSGSVAGRTGVALWNSGILLTRLLDTLTLNESDNNIPFFYGKTVLELGCGTAFASIAASKLGARYVIATDGNGEVLELARRNFERNGLLAPDSIDRIRESGEVSALKWGLMDASDFYNKADVIIGSDLTYNSGNWRVLVETLNSVLAPNGIVIYLTLGHMGFDVVAEMNGFFTVLESGGELVVVNEGSEDWPFRKVKSLSRLLNDTLNGKEKEVIASTGGYNVVILRRRVKNKFGI